jgi:hypothetical protein
MDFLVERELDALDIQLLKTGAEGEIVPRTIDHRRRLDRLDLEGYVKLERHGSPAADDHRSWVYHLTRKGQRAVNGQK